MRTRKGASLKRLALLFVKNTVLQNTSSSLSLDKRLLSNLTIDKRPPLLRNDKKVFCRTLVMPCQLTSLPTPLRNDKNDMTAPTRLRNGKNDVTAPTRLRNDKRDQPPLRYLPRNYLQLRYLPREYLQLRYLQLRYLQLRYLQRNYLWLKRGLSSCFFFFFKSVFFLVFLGTRVIFWSL